MANAGSGKTTALTARVVRLLLLGVPAERIVCITYTKAAASEMRARVLGSLRALLLADDVACAVAVEKLLGHAPNATHIARARQLFGLVLDSPSGGVQLTTIHGFCQNILRRFPLEAGIAPHFTVLEDSAADALLLRAKHSVLRSGVRDPWLAQALALIGERGGESRFDTLASDIIKKRELWKRVWHLQSPESLREHLWELHGVAVESTPASLAADCTANLGAEHEALMRAALPDMLTHKTKTTRECAEKMAAWLACDDAARLANLEAFVDIFLTKSFTARKSLLDAKVHPEGSPLALTMAHWLALVERYHAQRAALACAEETFAVANIARLLDLHYALAKEGQHALDYDDLIARTLALITQPEMIGWVMSKLDHRIDHLLIDEAQDNSIGQWQLAQVLVDELMASNEGLGSANLPRSLLVVGDEKQSIYSFQGAAPEAFAQYHRRFKAMLEGSPTPLHDATLSNSYRSTSAVLTLVDAVCAEPAMRAAISSTGQCAPHALIRTKDAGRVVLYPPVIAPEKAVMPALTIPLEYSITANTTQLLADKIADTVAQWIAEKRPLVALGRAIEAGDILILVRTRTRLVQTLIRAFEERDVPVAGMDRLTLADHLAVADLLALMRWCVNEGDDLALAQVLRSPLVGMSDDALRAIAHGRPGALWPEVSDPWLSKMRGLATLSPYDFLTHVLEVSNRREDFARRFGQQVHEVLDEFKAQAASMPASMPQTIAQFHDWMVASRRQIKREQEASGNNLLRIMTVHGAKGLEAPVVILADTVEVPTTQRETVFAVTSEKKQPLAALSISAISKFSPMLMLAKEAKKEAIIAEYHRLLYVAMTRARDELHVFGSASKKGEIKEGAWYETIRVAMKTCHATADGEVLMLADVVSEPKMYAAPLAKMAQSPLPAWAKAQVPHAQTVARSLSPSRLEVDAGGPYATTSSADARTRGVRIHRMLELMRADANAASIAQLARYVAPDWDEATQQEIVAKLEVLAAQQPWLWAHKRMAEVNVCGMIAHQGHSISVAGQIDLLIEKADEIIILDYKTGSHVPANESEVSLSYILQLKIYQALVRQIYPALPVRCAILWTHDASLMWLDARVEHTPFPELNDMLKTDVAA